MKNSLIHICLTGILSTLLFGVSQLTMAQPIDFSEFKKIAEGNNFTVEMKPTEDERIKIIIIKRVGKTEESHGLFDIQWDKKEEWEIFYYDTGSGSFQFVQSEGNTSTKAPFLGQWRIEEETNTLPDEIKFPELKFEE